MTSRPQLFPWPYLAFRTFAACLPSARRVLLGKWARVFFRFAARAAFRIFRLAADRCFSVVIEILLRKHRLVSPRFTLQVRTVAFL
jgi:hypothetical protein